MTMLTLNVQKRDILGKKVKKERDNGLLPLVVYGPGEPTSHFFAKLNEFIKVWKSAGETTVIKLEGDGQDKNVLIQEVSVHSITGTPIHADFYAVRKGMTVAVSVPLEFTGEAPAIKAYNGILVKVMHDIEVEAVPENLPQEIVIDVSSLSTLEDKITVGDIKLPEGVKPTASLDEIIALVSEVKEEKEESSEPIDLSKIEVEKKGKKEEEETSE